MNVLTNMGGPLSWNPAFKDWKRGEQVIHSPWPPSDDVNTPFFSTVFITSKDINWLRHVYFWERERKKTECQG